ncbi:hypothetical protein M440DRAFT_1173493 [Trichoderma longibrachiatum ATCC 18648]|uniref:Uncharacterized protein n=1 Tax=Trichoderma longibrachiatum ATCC 18648 TaxID=983965 RepID=A0A2T4CDE4_TRILO|nr:hypothetical protein M440DRAFT_1173493 [Trichoderma longibrachiatum ATCC 18648]
MGVRHDGSSEIWGICRVRSRRKQPRGLGERKIRRRRSDEARRNRRQIGCRHGQGEVPGGRGRGTAKRSDKVAEVRCLLEIRPEIRRAGEEEERWKEGENNGSRRGDEIGRRTEEEEEGREITDRLRSVVYSRQLRREAFSRQAPISTARRQTGCNGYLAAGATVKDRHASFFVPPSISPAPWPLQQEARANYPRQGRLRPEIRHRGWAIWCCLSRFPEQSVSDRLASSGRGSEGGWPQGPGGVWLRCSAISSVFVISGRGLWRLGLRA